MTTRNNTGEIKGTIRRFIAENLLFDNQGFALADDASFLGEGVVDSVGVMELVTFVSTRYQVEVDPQEITPENFDSVQRLAEFIERKLAGTAILTAMAQPEAEPTLKD